MIGYLTPNHCLIHALQLRPAARTRRESLAASRVFKMAPKLSDYFPDGEILGVKGPLDRPVSGVVVFSRTSKAAARLSAQFRDRVPRKRYLAIVEGALDGFLGPIVSPFIAGLKIPIS